MLHAASNYTNALVALALGERYGLPVVYEVRGFWEDTWLSRHPDGADLARSELYRRNRDLETRCMLAADLVVTLGEAMREEIVGRGVPAGKVLVVPNAVSEEFLRPLPDATATARKELGITPKPSTSSAWCPAWSRTRASARCSRRRGCCAPADCRCGR